MTAEGGCRVLTTWLGSRDTLEPPMSATVALDTQDLALELHALLRDIDPARWRREAEEAVRARIAAWSARAGSVLTRTGEDASYADLAGSVAAAQAVLDRGVPPEGLGSREWKVAWRRYRVELTHAYHGLSDTLAAWDIHVPSMRPTNYARNVLHVTSALIAVGLLELAPSAWLVPIGVFFVASAFLMETTRRFSPRINDALMWVFGAVAHPHETYRVNSASWYTIALLTLAILDVPQAAALGLVALGFGDPAAALVGRAYGRTRLINGRSLEGSLAFVGATVLAGTTLLRIVHPELGWAVTLAAAVTAGVVGAVVELLSRRIDDNLSIPVTAAFAGWAALLALGAV